GTERLEARIEVQRGGGPRRQHCIEHLGGHGSLARQGRWARVVQVVGAQALHEEVVDVVGGRVRRRSARRPLAGGVLGRLGGLGGGGGRGGRGGRGSWGGRGGWRGRGGGALEVSANGLVLLADVALE